MAQPDASASPPAKLIVRSYPTPDLRDRILVESRDSRTGGYILPLKGSPYEGREAPKYEGWIFATAVPSDKVGWVDHYYLNERANEDSYNFSIEYPWVDKGYPRYTRTYVLLRTDFEEPCPHQPDPKDPRLVLVSWKLDRSADPILDSLFVGVTKIFERVPAPTKVVLDRPESVLPFNQRVSIPAIIETEVQENATDGEAPEITNREDWHVEEATDTAFRKTVERTKRVVPDEGNVLEWTELTRLQQVANVTSTWKPGIQSVGTPRARVIESVITNVGNDTSIKETRIVPRVYPNAEHIVSIPDTVPPEFRDLLPIRTTGVTSEGNAAPPDLAPGELERRSEQVTELTHRETATGRDLDQLPKTLVDQLIDGIPTHGAEFGGVFDNERTLARGNQEVEEGFDIIRSSVKHLGSGLTARETERLTGFDGAHLLLTDPGTCYFCDPAVVFDGGEFGSGAAGTAILSTVPAGTGDPGQDPGGVFPLTFGSAGDANGVFYMLGARYNNGTWRNPAEAGNINITYAGNPAYPISDNQLDGTVDREVGPRLVIIPIPEGGGHYILYDLGQGRRLAANKITLRTNPASNAEFHKHIRVQGFNNPNEVRTTLAPDIALPLNAAGLVAGDTWVTANLNDTTAYRYFFLFGTDGPIPNVTPDLFPAFGFGEIELYGELTITPSAACNYIFDGDTNGVFYYLGRRGGGGTWRNPHTNGDIVVTADSLANGTVDEIVDRQPSNVYGSTSANQSFYFDLKEGQSLFCNKMSFRQRTQFGSGTQSFLLQARDDVLDPGAWVNLAAVQPSQSPDTWTTIDVASGASYRQFRIISPQPNFSIGEFELYGELALAPPAVISTYSVAAVQITAGGDNYAAPPIIRFTGGGGTGAAGTAVVSGGSVISVTMTNSGSGYTSAPTVGFLVEGGGRDGTATATISTGAIVSIAVDNPGSEYEAAPTVEIVGNGIGAEAHAEVSAAGQITAVIVDVGGTGYTVASILFRNAGGPTAVAHVGYGVESISVTGPGHDFIAPPAVRIEGDGVGATASATIGRGVSTVTINNRGSNYTSTPTVVFDPPGATGVATRGFSIASVAYSPNGTLYLTAPAVVLTGGGQYGQDGQLLAVIGRPILSCPVGAQGSGYASDPGVTISGDGSGAAAHSVRSFAVASIAVDTGGSGFTSEPAVTIAPPTGINGIQATAHSVLTADVVTSIVIDNPGFGYLTTPSVVLSGGGGSGATGTVTLETSGAVNSIVVDAVGIDYTAATVAISGGAATASVVLNTGVSGRLIRIDVVNGGTGYTSAPTLSVTGGTTPVASLGTAGQIVAVTVVNPGSGYSAPAAVTFSSGGGSGASGTAYLGTSGGIASVTVTNPGTGYTTPPEITFSGGGGADASAVATLSATGSISSLELIDPGPDYTVAPLVSFFGCWEGSVLPGLADSWDPDCNNDVRSIVPDGSGKVVLGGVFTTVGGQTRHRIARVDDETGALDSWDPDASADVFPIVIQGDGKIVAGGFFTTIGGQSRNRIARLDATTGLADSWNPNASSAVGALAIQDDGKIIAAGDFTSIGGASRSHIGRLDATTGSADSWDPSADNYVAAVTIQDDGKILAGGQFGTIGGQTRNYIARLDATTGAADSFNPNLNERVFAIAVQDDGKVLFGGQFTTVGGTARNFFARVNADGTLDTTFDPNPSSYVQAIVVQPNGKIVVAGAFTSICGTTRNRIARLNSDGTLDTDWNPDSDDQIFSLFHDAGSVYVGGAFSNIGTQPRNNAARIEGEHEGCIEATALYILGTGWPVLHDITTDPVEGIVVNIEKRIVRPGTQRPVTGGYIDIYALDKYRSIQITSAIDLNSLPPPEAFTQTHNISLPPLLLSVEAIYSRAQSRSIHINEGFGSASVNSVVQGNILVKIQSGFNGAAVANVIRSFIPYAPTVSQTPTPLFIQPAIGTAYLTTRKSNRSNSGGTTGRFAYVELADGLSEVVDTMDIKGVLTGAMSFGSGSGVQTINANSLANEGIVLAQARGINDTTNIGIAVAQSQASADASFFLAMEPSCPQFITPGTTFLYLANVEKWRFGLYVQTLIYITVPDCP